MSISFNQDFREFLGFLASNGVEYLVIGGYAVAAHGHPRYTKDLGVWIRPSLENGSKVISALKEFGFGSVGLTVEDFLEPDAIIQLGYPPRRIDLQGTQPANGHTPHWARRTCQLTGFTFFPSRGPVDEVGVAGPGPAVAALPVSFGPAVGPFSGSDQGAVYRLSSRRGSLGPAHVSDIPDTMTKVDPNRGLGNSELPVRLAAFARPPNGIWAGHSSWKEPVFSKLLTVKFRNAL